MLGKPIIRLACHSCRSVLTMELSSASANTGTNRRTGRCFGSKELQIGSFMLETYHEGLSKFYCALAAYCWHMLCLIGHAGMHDRSSFEGWCLDTRQQNSRCQAGFFRICARYCELGTPTRTLLSLGTLCRRATARSLQLVYFNCETSSACRWVLLFLESPQ